MKDSNSMDILRALTPTYGLKMRPKKANCQIMPLYQRLVSNWKLEVHPFSTRIQFQWKTHFVWGHGLEEARRGAGLSTFFSHFAWRQSCCASEVPSSLTHSMTLWHDRICLVPLSEDKNYSRALLWKNKGTPTRPISIPQCDFMSSHTVWWSL